LDPGKRRKAQDGYAAGLGALSYGRSLSGHHSVEVVTGGGMAPGLGDPVVPSFWHVDHRLVAATLYSRDHLYRCLSPHLYPARYAPFPLWAGLEKFRQSLDFRFYGLGVHGADGPSLYQQRGRCRRFRSDAGGIGRLCGWPRRGVLALFLYLYRWTGG